MEYLAVNTKTWESMLFDAEDDVDAYATISEVYEPGADFAGLKADGDPAAAYEAELESREYVQVDAPEGWELWRVDD